MRRAHPSYLKRTLIAVFCGMLMHFADAQQLPQFSQFMYNNLVLNPAYAGADEALSVSLLHRSQWTGVENAPSTQSLSIHTLVKKKQIGLGLTIVSDRIGVHKNTSILSNYAFHIAVKEGVTFSMGLQAGITNLKSDYASLAGTSADPKLANSVNETNLDFGAGLSLRSRAFQLGLSVPGLISQTVGLNDSLSVTLKKMSWLGYLRYRFTLTEAWAFEPAILVKYLPGLPVSIDGNLNFVFRDVFTSGVSYRSHESIDLLLRFQLTPQLQFGYAYDYPIQSAARLSSASHELMLSYVFRNYQRNVKSAR